MRRLLISLLAGLLLAAGLFAGPVHGHSNLAEGSPGPGDDVQTGTDLLALTFEQDLDPQGVNVIGLAGPDLEPVAVGEVAVVGAGDLCARSAPLAPGVHVLDYEVASADGHTVRGKYSFQVSDGGEPAQPGSCAGVELAAPQVEESGGGPVPAALWWGVGAVVVGSVALAGFRLRRERRA